MTRKEEKAIRKTKAKSNSPCYNENALVLDWREQEFRNLGFNHTMAKKMANTRMEVWGFRNLIEAGCTPELAFRLLEGTDHAGHDDPYFNWDSFKN